MYYTIKIVSNDSEFGLKSTDRHIIEKEVDIYFARIFGASAEFISKIGDVPDKKPVSALKDEQTQPLLQEDFFAEKKEQQQNVIANPKPEIVDIRANNNNLSDELTEATGSYLTKNNINSNPLDENIELEKEAKAMYQELQNQVSAQQQTNSHMSALDAFDNTVSNQSTRLFEKNAPASGTNQAFQDIIDIYNEQDTLKNTPKKEELNNFDDIFNNSKQPLNNNQTENQTQKNDTDRRTNEEIYQNATISLNDYLVHFSTKDIEDELLITAMYSKKILHEKAFTIKSINSKLFQATGKIADTSVIDELIKKEYIICMQVDDSTRYSITTMGEAYLGSIMPN